MNKIEKPIFTPDESDETKTKIHFGYDARQLKLGPVFTEQPKKHVAKFRNSVKELLNGTARKRHNHKEINKFACANFFPGTNEIYFNVKYPPKSVFNSIAKSALSKYEQLLGYYLNDSGWANVKQDKINHSFIVKLNDPVNLANFLSLSSSIGFDASNPLPEIEDIKRAESAIRYLNRQERISQKATEHESYR